MTRPDRHPRRNAAMPDRARPELRVDPEPVRRHLESGDSGGVFVWIGVMALLAIVAYAVFLVVVALMPPAPRSAPEPTALFDVSQGASAPEPAGASRSEAEQRRPAGDELNLLVAGAPPRFRGLATWYCLSGSSACTTGYSQADLVAAIDTDLGFVRGDRIRVRYGDRSVVVEVVDVCRCPGDRLVDLTSGAFARLADLEVGVIPVLIELESPHVTLPPTETMP